MDDKKILTFEEAFLPQNSLIDITLTGTDYLGIQATETITINTLADQAPVI